MAVLLDIYFSPDKALRAALDKSLHDNIGSALTRVDTKSDTIILQIERLSDGGRLHVYLHRPLFIGCDSFKKFLERDPALMTKLILFFA